MVGWYILEKPGYKIVADDNLRALHGQFFQKITTVLRALPVKLPVMVSPSVPRAIEGNQTSLWFIERFDPVMKTAGVDVWAMQDGYKMTAWTPEANAAMIRAAQSPSWTLWLDSLGGFLYTPSGPRLSKLPADWGPGGRSAGSGRNGGTTRLVGPSISR